MRSRSSRRSRRAPRAGSRSGFVGSLAHGVLPLLVRELRRQRARDRDRAARGQHRAADRAPAPRAARRRASCGRRSQAAGHRDRGRGPRAAARRAAGGASARRRAASLRLEALRDEPFVLFPRAIGPGLYDQIVGLCRAAGFSPNVVYESSATATMVAMVEAGVGVTVLPASHFGTGSCALLAARGRAVRDRDRRSPGRAAASRRSSAPCELRRRALARRRRLDLAHRRDRPRPRSRSDSPRRRAPTCRPSSRPAGSRRRPRGAHARTSPSRRTGSMANMRVRTTSDAPAAQLLERAHDARERRPRLLVGVARGRAVGGQPERARDQDPVAHPEWRGSSPPRARTSCR